MAKVLITDTILRDAHQSPGSHAHAHWTICCPRAKYWIRSAITSLECWGGATFDTCLRFLNEDPWERLRKLRKALPNTKLQMLFRGQNILGYKHYADDVVEEFCRKRRSTTASISSASSTRSTTPATWRPPSTPPRNTAASAKRP